MTLLWIFLALLFFLLVGVVSMVRRVLPVIKNSRSNTNTHSGSFKDGQNTKNLPGECLHLPASVDLSVVAPAYNEEERVGDMLKETIDFLEKRKEQHSNFTYEVIVVNDGSKDKTDQEVLKFTKLHGFESVRLLQLDFNCGKGAAINKGIRYSRGKAILFADADAATKFDGLVGLEKELSKITNNKLGCVVGSRYLSQDTEKAERSALRKFVSKTFHALVMFVCGADIKDTQCGFKLFTRAAAQHIFPNQHVDRWAFDVEVLYLCSHFSIPMGEVAVTWREVEGSKMTISGAVGMLRDILLIRVLYVFGVWKVKAKSS